MTWASRVFSGYANRDGSEVVAERLRRRRTVWRDGGRGRETGCQWEDCEAGLPHAGFWVPGRRQARARHLPILPLAAVDTQVQPGCNRICSAYQFSASAECRPLFDAVKKKKMILKQKKEVLGLESEHGNSSCLRFRVLRLPGPCRWLPAVFVPRGGSRASPLRRPDRPVRLPRRLHRRPAL